MGLLFSSRVAAVAALIVAIAHTCTSEVVAQNLELPKLPYDYDALEPAIDKETMQIHHLKHHQAYLNTINTALTALRSEESTKYLAKMGVDEVLKHLDEIPAALQAPVRNGGGGFVNHVLFWNSMCPNGTKVPDPSEPLGEALVAEFGSVMAFQDAFHDKAIKLFGSGWTWLSYDLTASKLLISTTPNQDTPAMAANLVPLLALDVWEHAYYLKYQNKRMDYVTAFWTVVNWEEVSRRYQEARGKAKQEL